MSWQPLNPYVGSRATDDELTGEALAREVQFFKDTADEQGLPHDPEWDRWLAEDGQGPTPGARGLAEVKRRFGT